MLDYGLTQETRGKPIENYSPTVKKLLKAGRDRYLISNSHSTSTYFNPKLVFIGFESDKESRKCFHEVMDILMEDDPIIVSMSEETVTIPKMREGIMTEMKSNEMVRAMEEINHPLLAYVAEREIRLFGTDRAKKEGSDHPYLKGYAVHSLIPGILETLEEGWRAVVATEKVLNAYLLSFLEFFDEEVGNYMHLFKLY